MKTHFKVTGLLMIALFCSITLSAQYVTAAGLRLGSPNAVSVKHFISESNALEVYVGVRDFSLGATQINAHAAYLRHQKLDKITDGLTWYFGGGLGVYSIKYSNPLLEEFSGKKILMKGYAGVEYTFKKMPLALSVDWIPNISLFNINSFGAKNGGLGVRYIFKRD